MTAQEVLDKKWGVRTRPIVNRLTGSLGTSVAQVLPNDPNRLAWVVVNLSSNTVYLGLERDVSFTKGIMVQGGGGSASMTLDEDYNMVTYEIWGVAGGSSSAIYTIEVVIY